jgi:hypothetical protein
MTIEARIGIVGGNGWLGNAIAQAAVATGCGDTARRRDGPAPPDGAYFSPTRR